MSFPVPIPMVRCHLDGVDEDPARALRFVPAAEFELWRYFMETRHGRKVAVDEVSVWVPETAQRWSDDIEPDLLEPVLRIDFEKPGPNGSMVPVQRFFPAETYPEARAALLTHFDPRCRWTVAATPGYFVPAACARVLRQTAALSA